MKAPPKASAQTSTVRRKSQKICPSQPQDHNYERDYPLNNARSRHVSLRFETYFLGTSGWLRVAAGTRELERTACELFSSREPLRLPRSEKFAFEEQKGLSVHSVCFSFLAHPLVPPQPGLANNKMAKDKSSATVSNAEKKSAKAQRKAERSAAKKERKAEKLAKKGGVTKKSSTKEGSTSKKGDKEKKKVVAERALNEIEGVEKEDGEEEEEEEASEEEEGENVNAVDGEEEERSRYEDEWCGRGRG